VIGDLKRKHSDLSRRMPLQVWIPVPPKGSWTLRFVIEHNLDFFHDLRRELCNDGDCPHVVLYLFGPGCAKNDSADIGVLSTPSQAQLRDIATKTLSNLCQPLDLLDLGLALGGLEGRSSGVEEVLVVGEARALWDTVVIFASKETGSKRGPDGRSVLKLLVERSVFDLEALAVKC
jgi:hypothetical protein